MIDYALGLLAWAFLRSLLAVADVLWWVGNQLEQKETP